ncbi:serpin 4C [Anopheles sinensis]|nr:serpin 4C [Anopheles sinensis]
MHASNAISLKEVLEQLGAPSMFNRDEADLFRLFRRWTNEDDRYEDSYGDLLGILQDTKENAIRRLQERNPNCTNYSNFGVGRSACYTGVCEWGAGTCVCCAVIDPKGDFRRRRRRLSPTNMEQERMKYINEMLHKVDLAITEVGTEEDRATATDIDRLSSQVTFHVNAPFLMVIREETTRLPLFYGTVYSP